MTQLLLHSYPQLLLVLVGTSLEHSVSYNDGESVCYYVLITAENDLCDVLDMINDLNNWKQLGLQLGLLYSSLKRIDLEERGIVTSCQIEMLSAWLQQQDNVKQRGVPSWSVLRAALQRMGEHETADRISN